jgi:hypothetical protein
MVWILVPNPPRERPIAWSSPSWGAGTVLMSLHDGAVDHRVFVVGIGGEMVEDPFPGAGFGPAAEAPVSVLPVAEAFRQIAPGNAGEVAIQHRFDEQAVICCGHPDRTLLARQQVLDPVPLLVAKSISAHRSARSKLTVDESKNAPRRNRLFVRWADYRPTVAILTHLPAPDGAATGRN